MSKDVNRRSFMKKSFIASAGASMALSLEEKLLLAQTKKKSSVPAKKEGTKGMPMGKIGNLKVSRLLSGGNMIGGWAHSRDLLYVGSLMKAYNTDKKVMDTLELCEENGINTIIAHLTAKRLITKYWKERGGKIQWVVDWEPQTNDWETELKKYVDCGASAIYVEGVVADKWVQDGRLDLIEKLVEIVKKNGVLAGVGAHCLDVIVWCEDAEINPDFYVKTLHSGNYWSAKRPDQNAAVINNPQDNYWSVTPEKTIEFMKKVDKPWIAFKVLAAGAIHPNEGFRYALENGADFICVGMFDFQVKEDVAIAKNVLNDLAASKISRVRPWKA